MPDLRQSTSTVLQKTWAGAQWAWLLVAFFLGWEVVFRISDSLFVPATSEMLAHLGSTWFSTDPGQLFTSDLFRDNAVPSLIRFAWGWGISVVVGIVGGVLLGRSETLEAIFRPIVRFGMSTPSTILLPVAIVLFGITDRMTVFLIVAGAVWPVLVNTMDGVRGLDRQILRSAKSLRLRGWRLLVKIVLPAASPQIFAGLRVSLGISLILVVIAEMFAASSGIGFQIIFAQRTFAFLDMWAAVTLVGILALLFNGLFFLVERALLGWHREAGARG